MKITVFDYGAGNLHSLCKTLSGDQRRVSVEPDPELALDTDVLVLPGVGAFAPAAAALAPARAAMRAALERGLPCLGICLGHQLLFDTSEEGPGAGVGFFSGVVTKFTTQRVPQIGWNALEDPADPLFASAGLTMAYFANGFVARPTRPQDVVAWATHEHERFPAAVRRGNVLGVQFHPEKSSAPGVAFVRRFLETAVTC